MWRGVGFYSAAGIQFASAVVGGVLLGYWLDGRWHTAPWLMITGVTLGFIGGVVNLVKIVKLIERKL